MVGRLRLLVDGQELRDRDRVTVEHLQNAGFATQQRARMRPPRLPGHAPQHDRLSDLADAHDDGVHRRCPAPCERFDGEHLVGLGRDEHPTQRRRGHLVHATTIDGSIAALHLGHAALEHASRCDDVAMGSPQTLSLSDRRIVAAWAADCAERVLWIFEAEAPQDRRPQDAIARTRAFARGELDVAEEIRRRFAGGGAARDARSAAAAAAARAAGQAAAVAHMGAHALGAAAYAAKAAGLAAPDQRVAVVEEIRWQLGHMSGPVSAALRRLPPLGEDSAGPLGPGLLASGLQGTIIRELQAGLSEPDVSSRPARDADI